jgi:hypothetical protein
MFFFFFFLSFAATRVLDDFFCYLGQPHKTLTLNEPGMMTLLRLWKSRGEEEESQGTVNPWTCCVFKASKTPPSFL